MAEGAFTVKVGLDVSSLIAGLRDAANRLEASQQLVTAHARVTLDEALDEVESMVGQHCYPVSDGVYETGALSANRDAFDLLVRAGRAEYVPGGEPYGRMATVRLTPPVVRRDGATDEDAG